jgi:DnaK suppressor protein
MSNARKPIESISSSQDGDSLSGDLTGAYPEFTRLLMVKKNEIMARNQDARHHLDEQILDSPGDEADASVIDTSADYFLKLANTLQDELREIDAAFDRIHRHVYGQCESCDEEIGRARLRHLPEARLCIDCQSLAERNQAAAYPRARPKL